MKDYGKAEEALQRALKLGYADPDSLYLYLGQTAESAGKPEEAMDWYRRVEAGDNLFAARVRQANLLARQGKAEEGAALIRGVPARNDEQRAQIALAESRLWRDIKENTRAYEVLGRALAKQPDNVELLYDHALAAEKLGRYDVLEKDLRRVIKVKPAFAEAYNALGYTFADRNERLDEAQALLDKALSLDPDSAFILDSAGWLSYRRHDLTKAEELLRRALSLRDDPEIAAHLGEVLWAEGRRGEAESLLQKALRDAPDSETVRATLERVRSGQ
jgi:Flp pilus assembly protein TadD